MPFCAWFLKMFTGACKKEREMDWQLVASYFTVKSTEIFYSDVESVRSTKMFVE